VPLFTRMGRGVCLTPSGEALLRDARRILAQIEETKERTVAVMNGEAGVVRLGYTVGTCRHRFVQNLIWSSHVALPGFDFQIALLTADQLVQQLREGDIQAGLTYSGVLEEDFGSFHVATESYQLAVPSDHALAHVPTVKFQNIQDENFIWYGKALEPSMHAKLTEAFRARGAIPKIVAESPNADTTLRWVAERVGIAFVPRYDQAGIPAGVTLRAVEDFPLEMSFRLIWLRQSESSVLTRLIETMGKIMAGTTAAAK
jgi:DNA-binding transcriptional LysR family regulator